MCLYPRLIRNPKYKPTKKNGGIVPELKDKRVMAIPVPCGNCMECRKKKARDWQVRLGEDIRHYKHKKFVTFSFSNESLSELGALIDRKDYYKDCNSIATLAMRRFLERWRKKYKRSVRHWMVTELGEKRSRIHLHGILYTDEDNETIESIWKYGHVFIGDYVTEKTVNYIVKYIHKVDLKHKGYKSKVLTSAGIGKGYLSRVDSKNNRYKGKDTKEVYITRSGHKMGLPTYYRNHIYSDEEKEQLWIQKLNKETRYVLGKEVDVSDNLKDYLMLLKEARKENKFFKYGGREGWTLEKYLEELGQIG